MCKLGQEAPDYNQGESLLSFLLYSEQANILVKHSEAQVVYLSPRLLVASWIIVFWHCVQSIESKRNMCMSK